ncbi:hypothetical protein DPMN_161526 [Dreissena polymorpha]|uniref:Uncharacterized protein n=1 Tax=Dreissena polymorpha TaxID=45954 RepID=A0A9D4EQ36_DREPO|nr:hypothetical protein DPMN_161526 [Dreissena polymorpha]
MDSHAFHENSSKQSTVSFLAGERKNEVHFTKSRVQFLTEEILLDNDRDLDTGPTSRQKRSYISDYDNPYASTPLKLESDVDFPQRPPLPKHYFRRHEFDVNLNRPVDTIESVYQNSNQPFKNFRNPESAMGPFRPVCSQTYGMNDGFHENFYSHKPKKQSEILPDKFDEKSTEFSDNIIHFEQVGMWKMWSVQEKACMLSISLKGEAQKLLSSLRPDQHVHYQEIKYALSQCFAPIERGLAYRCQFRNRKRLRDESVIDYGYEIRRLGQKAFPNMDARSLEIC